MRFIFKWAIPLILFTFGFSLIILPVWLEFFVGLAFILGTVSGVVSIIIFEGEN